MWWCCGKTNKDALGCKYNKHESKEDDDEEEAREKEEEKYKMKRVKCQCCKEVGHHTQDCYRDPNLITKRDTNEELSRLNKLREFRKLNLDTIEIPTRLMKKLAVNAEENAFARGVLCFDDYNYKFHNSRLLEGGKKHKGHKKDSREKLFIALLDRERNAQGDPEREAPAEGEEGEENDDSSSSD